MLPDNYPFNWSSSSVSNTTNVPPAIGAIMHGMYILVSIAVVGGNGFVCLMVIAYQRMRTVTNFFIVNLAVGDILMACLCIPFGFVYNLLRQYWPFGPVMCALVSYAQVVSVLISAYTLVAISVDRYTIILHPLRPRMTKLQAKLIIMVVWIVALLTPLPTAILSRLEMHPAWIGSNDTVRYICTEMWHSTSQRYNYSMALVMLQYFFPLAILIYNYTRVIIAIWGQRTPDEADDIRGQRLAASNRKIVKMMITVVTVFTLCWLPLNILILVGDQYDRIWKHKYIVYVWFVCHWLAMSHASYNPLIYCWMNSMYRDGLAQLCRRLACKGCCLMKGGKTRRYDSRVTYTNARSRRFSPDVPQTSGQGLCTYPTTSTGTRPKKQIKAQLYRQHGWDDEQFSRKFGMKLNSVRRSSY